MTDPLELARWLESYTNDFFHVSDTTDRLHAAAAALRAGAEREATLTRERDAFREQANAAMALFDNDHQDLRRKVAKYIGAARRWMWNAADAEVDAEVAMVERDEALDALRALEASRGSPLRVVGFVDGHAVNREGMAAHKAHDLLTIQGKE